MAAVKEWQGIRYIMHLLIINLVACLAWLSGIAFAQLELSEGVTGSVSFPDGAIACLGNLAVFFTSLLRGRLDLENGARDVLATNRGPNFKEMEMGSGLTTCIGRNYKDAKVIMLSPNTSTSPNSIRQKYVHGSYKVDTILLIQQFMKYVHHCHNVETILLKCLGFDPARESKVVTAEPCLCGRDSRNKECGCIVLWTEKEEIRMMIARRMPGILKPLSDSLCLLPCWSCLRNGCHGCNQGLLHVKQTEEESSAESPRIHAEQSKSFRLQSAVVTAELCCDQFHECNCNVLWTDEEEIRMMASRWMPGTLKRMSNSLSLLPSWDCLRRGCHGLLQTEEDSSAEAPEIHAEPEPESEQTLREKESNAESRGEIHVDVEETPRRRLTVEGSKAESPAAVCQMLDSLHWRNSVGDGRRCICIPLCEAGDDEWTKLMIRFLRCEDQVSTRKARVTASDAMEKYIDRSGEVHQGVYQPYNNWSLIMPRLIEVSVNIVLTGWLKVDGFSSALIARRVVRDYLLDNKGTGFTAHAFLTNAKIHCSESSVCQELWLRGNIVGARTLSYIVGSVNLMCSITWGVLVACEGRYAIHSMPPSKPALLIMLAFIGVALLMDFQLFKACVAYLLDEGFRGRRLITVYLGGILLEIVYIVVGSVMVVKGMGIGRWVYSALQALIWIKWGMGSYLLGDCHNKAAYYKLTRGYDFNPFFNKEIMVYSSAFMLSAVLTGVRGKWEY